MRTYFITGATGVVGGALLKQLLADTDGKAILLIRGQSDEEVNHRLSDLLQSLEGEPNRFNAAARVSAVRGDITLQDLGLAHDIRSSLASCVTNIVHAGASVHMRLALPAARAVAVNSAAAVIDLARLCANCERPAKIEFISTVGVNGRRTEPLPEAFLDQPRAFHNTYEEAKAEAESLVAEALRESIPITLHRPSMVVGNSVSGEVASFQIFYHICDFLTGRQTTGFVPALGDFKLDIVPADYLARALLAASRDDGLSGRVLNLCSGSGQSVLLRDLQRRVKTQAEHLGISCPRTKTVPPRLFQALTTLASKLGSGKRRRSLAMMSILLDYLASPASFENQLTTTLLADRGVLRPSPDSYLDAVIAYYFRRAHAKD